MSPSEDKPTKRRPEVNTHKQHCATNSNTNSTHTIFNERCLLQPELPEAYLNAPWHLLPKGYLQRLRDYMIARNITQGYPKAKILAMAFVHSSALTKLHQQFPLPTRSLALLGDSLLDAMCASFCMQHSSNISEKSLHLSRTSMLSNNSLQHIAKNSLGFDDLFIVGQLRERPDSMYSTALEAFVGALYLTGGFTCSAAFVSTHVFPELWRVRNELMPGAIESLFILCRRLHDCEPEFRVCEFNLKDDEKDKQREVKIEMFVRNKYLAAGSGTNLKKAKQAACELVLSCMGPAPESLI